ncbi:MAG: FAD-dependent oxidoreductase [Rhodobacter sp.]|uniref:GcvT family protein n=1 Tax=Pararhodobacter sp. TaxID=2127056 RepID=UPI001DC36456|nr:FAD-dependent oxidoreductase [Pararhodobacter sp.]MCB1344513.1 FAD-dependent oxidoreductase [Paracoccaceae bacterium]MCC0073018.1 FAD-dependent oxidoreductase [Rhodobacter sp.]HPD91952.1 FAD-dependent oxidoreductase [Pararhodobacter sp.]
MVETARVVIIGGGAVGTSALYHLAKAGWTDCLLLERNELTAGSTWHAAGNVPTFSSSWSIMNMQRYSAQLYRGLGDAVDYPMNYHVTGSVRLGHSAERLREFQKVAGMGRYQGMDLAILSPSEIRDRYPFLETHDLTGALYDPYDGDIDPAQLTQALAAGARQMGARIDRFRPVTAARREGDEWVLDTPKGEVRCEYVVNAGGYYAARVGAMFGRRVPMMVMSHQYLLFDTIPELERWSHESGHKLPLLRDVDSSYYLRQEKMGFNLGPYENPCRAHWATPDDPMPEDFSFQLYPDDLERLEWHIADAMARVPLLEQARLQKVINGPIPYTPDGNPLIGPMPGVPNAFEACVFTFGICQAGGAGKVLAEWVTEGGTEWDMWSCDPRRFTGFEDHDYCVAKGKEVYGHEYAIHFPMARWPAGADRKLSPVHAQLKSLGAQMGAFNGWERAEWFAQPGDDTSWQATQTFRRAGPWEPRIKAECEAVRDGCGVLDLPGFTRLRLVGPGARAHLESLTASRIPAPGRTGLLYFPDARGRIVTEMTVLPASDADIGVITAGVAQSHDADLLRRNLPAGVTIEDWSDRIHCFIVTGPKARTVLSELTDGDLDLPWLSVQFQARVAGRDVALIRVSFAGELGWEVHCDPADAATIHAALLDAGATPFGMKALNSLRIEKAYRAWKGDLSTDYSLLEGGLGRFIDWSGEFPGKAALQAEKAAGPAKRFTVLTVNAPDFDPPYMANVWAGDTIVGEVTSAAWGYRVNACVALAMIRTAHTAPGTPLEIEIFGQRHAATVHGEGPLWDPTNARLRA